MFNSYVKLPEGIHQYSSIFIMVHFKWSSLEHLPLISCHPRASAARTCRIIRVVPRNILRGGCGRLRRTSMVSSSTQVLLSLPSMNSSIWADDWVWWPIKAHPNCSPKRDFFGPHPQPMSGGQGHQLLDELDVPSAGLSHRRHHLQTLPVTLWWSNIAIENP